MNVVAYCRVSTDKFDQINSLETQKKFFEEFAVKNNLNLVKIYSDEGISGTKVKNRYEFLNLLKDAELGTFGQVIVKDISRFSRNTVDLLNATRKLKSLNIDLKFITFDMKILENSELLLTIFGALAQEESANISKRVKFGKLENAKKGRVPNFVYGYDKVIGELFTLKINKEEAYIVEKIFDLYVNFGYGENKIAKILNENNIKTKKKYDWSQNAISRILHNEIYIGKIFNKKSEVRDFLTSNRLNYDKNDWILSTNENLIIISSDMFLKAQAILKMRNENLKISGIRHSNKHLFSTLITCSCCNSRFRRIKKGENYTRWVCTNRNLNGIDACENSIKVIESDLKSYFEHLFLSLFKNDKSLMTNVRSLALKKMQDLNISTPQYLQNKINALNKSKNRYQLLFDDFQIPLNIFHQRQQELSNEISDLKTKIKNMENINLIEDESEIIKKIDNNMLKKLINMIYIYENGSICIDFKVSN